jgi:3-methyladenine DNA glycosylase/8-oxoguanine DNA glycosylase
MSASAARAAVGPNGDDGAVVESSLRPRGPFSLALSAALSSDATRRFRDGVLTAALPEGGVGRAWQRPDGTVELRATDEAALARLRACLPLDDDHSEFVERFRGDPLLGRSVGTLRGLRVVRVATVAHALLRALCGQLVDSRTARQVERRVIAATSARGRRAPSGLFDPPTARDLGRLSPAQLRAAGLHARRGATLVRLCRSTELERLRAVPSRVAADRLARERGLGPWSAGVVCLHGLGRAEVGLVGDLGLIKLCRVLHGRPADADDTARLLERYGEWAGLASVYLLAGLARGLVPLPLAA